MSIWEVNNHPTIEKIEKYNEEARVYFRYQDKDYELGTKSWGMIYGSEEEAREAYEQEGLNPDDAILNGKSACSTSNEALNFASEFCELCNVVLVISGRWVEEGHDGEDVVDVSEVLEVWDYDEFCNLAYFIKYGEELPNGR